MVDPREIEAAKQAMAELEKAFFAAAQAMNRVLLILDMEAPKAPALNQLDAVRELRLREAKQLGYSGDVCSNCGSFKMTRTGTCLTCTTCGQSRGCS